MPYDKTGNYYSPTKQVTEHIREWLSDAVDTNFDWDKAAKDYARCCSLTPSELIAEWQAKLLKCTQKDAFATDDGGSPKIGFGRVLKVGMAAQWPYWTPRPCVIIESAMWGSKWIDFTMISCVEIS